MGMAGKVRGWREAVNLAIFAVAYSAIGGLQTLPGSTILHA